VKVIAAAAIMGLVVAAGWRAWLHFVVLSKLTHVIGLIVLVALGAAVYAGLVWVFKIEGRADLTAILAKLRGKFARAGAAP
jgi:hypothetical protein